jgi:PDZ domain/Aspartyl protease
MKVILTLFVFGCASLQAQHLQTLGFRLADGKSSITIPIEINNNLIIMPVVINGQLPLRFILDTGVRTAILTEKSYSDILGLPYSRQYTIAGPGGEHLITAYVTNNISFYIPPGVTGTGHSMLVLEKDYLELRNYLGAEVHGVLGYEIFSRFVVLINYQEKYIELIDPAKFKPKRRKYQQVPISVEDTKPFVETSAMLGKKKTLKLLVDTGASHSLMLDPESDKEIQIPEKHIATTIGRALGGEITGKIGRIQSLDLGKYKLPNVIANYPDPNSYMDTLKASSVSRNGAIGGEILTRFTVIFDYSNGKMYLRKNSTFKKAFQNNLSGITIKAKGAKLKVFEVIEVRKKSVAEREEVQVGDLIVSVNGTPASSLSLNEINGELNSKPGKKVTLVLERGGQRIRKMIALESEI